MSQPHCTVRQKALSVLEVFTLSRFTNRHLLTYLLNNVFFIALQELVSMISGRVPAEVEMALRKLMATYAGNITSVLCQFPSQQVHLYRVFIKIAFLCVCISCTQGGPIKTTALS